MELTAPWETADSSLLAIDLLQAALVDRDPADVAWNKIVTLTANCFETDVGSLYLVQPDGRRLRLSATVGLRQSCVGRLKLRFDEGLVGLVAEQQSPVVLAHASNHPRFKYCPEADEDRYESFLGVPVMAGRELLGVLVVQTIEPREFTETETLHLSRVAALVGMAHHALDT